MLSFLLFLICALVWFAIGLGVAWLIWGRRTSDA
jgi:hypothetical protein